ncbi:LysR family transcriptional regulator [Leptothoe spongobia]|uniref:LysR family transcriptional regulator n=1 Tax=Leptothoe spongobia TAU-MAC 1115 TaxID=1967444 RepID=A0A947GKU3_9CYAN|nr:LysR substrate-binding domain-containing protein [Leptothoe spongobia]MBT9317814.1 LysR family transcriptional regulator [Leptothoe spongobia TAU-MAC 1115]
MNFNAIALFVKVVQYGSFSETARRTGTPVATVSRRIQALEKALGVRLLERSTRRLRLTDAGASFWQYANQGVEAFETGLSTLDRDQLDLSGKLRLSLPPGFVPWRQLLQDFQVRYPNVKFDVLVTERRVDLIEDGIDVALRIGDRKHEQAIAHKLGEYRHVLVANSSLLQKYGTLQSPKQLLQMPCASWKAPADTITWQLGSESIQIAPRLQVNDYLHLLELAIAGVYVTELPPFLARAAIFKGDLVHLLEDYPLPMSELNLLYPSRRHLSRLVRTYIDFCSQWVVDLF